jgi:hypothetical protein
MSIYGSHDEPDIGYDERIDHEEALRTLEIADPDYLQSIAETEH